MDHKSGRPMWMMVLCCLIPIVALGAVLLLRVPVSGAVSLGLILLCPLSHLLMMGIGQRTHGEAPGPGATKPRGSAAEDGPTGFR